MMFVHSASHPISVRHIVGAFNKKWCIGAIPKIKEGYVQCSTQYTMSQVRHFPLDDTAIEVISF